MFNFKDTIKFSSLFVILSAPAIGQEFLDRKGATFSRDNTSPIQFLKTDLTSQEKSRSLSFDNELNRTVYETISSGVREYQAKRGAAYVMDINTGEILAMASIDNNDKKSIANDHIDNLIKSHGNSNAPFNLVTQGTYEIGFSAKAVTVALAIDAGRISQESMIDAREPIKFGKYIIDDFKPEGRRMNVSDVVINSSNIGHVRIQQKLGSELFKRGLEQFGSLIETTVNGLHTNPPVKPLTWTELNMATIAYGHGLAVTPIQAGAMIATIANGGYRIQPTIYKTENTKKGERIISEQTSVFMRSVMRRVVVEGSGQNANLPMVEVGGLTSTFNKKVGDQYLEDHVVSTFAGVFPADNPKYLVFTLLDDPQPTEETHGYRTAGWNAVPLAAEIISKMQ